MLPVVVTRILLWYSAVAVAAALSLLIPYTKTRRPPRSHPRSRSVPSIKQTLLEEAPSATHQDEVYPFHCILGLLPGDSLCAYYFPGAFFASHKRSRTHTGIQELWVNGVSQGHKVGIRVPDYDGVRTSVLYLILLV